MYSLKRTVAPVTEPVTLGQAKGQCRLDVDDTSEDALLGVYVQAAREFVEQQTGRSLITQTWVLTRERFPGISTLAAGLSGIQQQAWGGCDLFRNRVPELLLPYGDVLTVVSVQYFDATGALQTLDPATYVADLSGNPARLAPLPGAWWPATAWRIDAVQVTYTAGYGATAAAVPASLQLAMLLLIGHWYENREGTQAALQGNGPMPLPLGVDALLSPFTSFCLTYES